MQVLDTVTGMWGDSTVEIHPTTALTLERAGWFVYGFDPESEGYAVEVEWTSGEHGIRFGTEEEFDEWFVSEKWFDDDYTGSDEPGYWKVEK